MHGIEILNFSTFFNRELMLYALGDIRFKKPKSVKTIAYFLLFFILWTLPLVYLLGIPTNPYLAAIEIGPPIGLGITASKNIWGGWTLFGFIKVSISYVAQPQCWTDFKPSLKGMQTNNVNAEVWVSRRRELMKLSLMKEKRLAKG